MDVYDFIDACHGNVVGSWIRGLSTSDRAKFKLKIRYLSDVEYDEAIRGKLLQGPIYKHVYKLKIHGDIMLRPLLCRGPINNDVEYTLLAGAKEENFNLVPEDAPEVAENRRAEVIGDPSNRRQIRVRSSS
jgi:hypothetical protein